MPRHPIVTLSPAPDPRGTAYRPVERLGPPAEPSILAVTFGDPVGVAFGTRNCLVSATMALDAAGQTEAERLSLFQRELDTFRRGRVTEVVFSAVRSLRDSDAIRTHRSLRGALYEWCAEHDLRCSDIPAGVTRKFEASNRRMIAAATGVGTRPIAGPEHNALVLWFYCTALRSERARRVPGTSRTEPPPAPFAPYLTASQLAELIGITTRTLRRYVKNGLIQQDHLPLAGRRCTGLSKQSS